MIPSVWSTELVVARFAMAFQKPAHADQSGETRMLRNRYASRINIKVPTIEVREELSSWVVPLIKSKVSSSITSARLTA
jgi:hypothetical protein